MDHVLGATISFTHRAGVVRRRKERSTPEGWRYGAWYFPVKGNGTIPNTSTQGDELRLLLVTPKIETRPITIMGTNIEPGKGEVPDDWNKSVGVWEQPGTAVVVGLERKMLGKSVAGGGGGEDWEPGWLEARGHIDLYRVRWELKGTSFQYVPVWAATVAS